MVRFFGSRGWVALKRAGCCALSLVALACGGETSGAGACTAAAACGGDITGKWNVVATCDRVTGEIEVGGGFPEECKPALVQGANTGTTEPRGAAIEFDDQGGYVQTGEMFVATSFTFSAACLQATDSTSTADVVCSGLQAAYEQQFGSASCSLANGACSCSAQGTLSYENTGTYRLDGNQILFDDEGGGSYCVEGDTASIAMRGKGIEGTLELER